MRLDREPLADRGGAPARWQAGDTPASPSLPLRHARGRGSGPEAAWAAAVHQYIPSRQQGFELERGVPGGRGRPPRREDGRLPPRSRGPRGRPRRRAGLGERPLPRRTAVAGRHERALPRRLASTHPDEHGRTFNPATRWSRPARAASTRSSWAAGSTTSLFAAATTGRRSTSAPATACSTNRSTASGRATTSASPPNLSATLADGRPVP